MDCLDCLGACAGHLGGAAHVIWPCAVRALVRVVSSASGPCAGALPCAGCIGPPKHEIGAVAHADSLEALVRGDAIRNELLDTEVDRDGVVGESTRTAKDFIGKCPFFFFGLTRSGKSTGINDCLEELGDISRPAKQDFMFACTRNVDVYRNTCTSWATPGVAEEVLFIDTEGWEFGKTVQDNFKKCMDLAKSENIQPDVLQRRLVLVCVLKSEDRHMLRDEKYLKLLSDTCEQALAAAKGGLPVLLPVLTKHDLLSQGERQRTLDEMDTHLKEVIAGDKIEVRKALSVSHVETDDDGRRPSVQRLLGELRAICASQLKSQHILDAVKDIIECDLKRCLQDWDKKGRDSPHALVRRFLWVAARHRGLRLRIRNLYELKPTLPWDGTEKIRKELKNVRAKEGGQQRGSDDWHTDPRRVEGPRRRHSGTSTTSTQTADDELFSLSVGSEASSPLAGSTPVARASADSSDLD